MSKITVRSSEGRGVEVDTSCLPIGTVFWGQPTGYSDKMLLLKASRCIIDLSDPGRVWNISLAITNYQEVDIEITTTPNKERLLL